MTRTTVTVDRATPAGAVAEAAAPAGGVHLRALEQALGRVFTFVAVLYVLDFWATSGALSGQRPGSLAASLLLSLLLIGLAVRTLRRPLSQRDLNWLAAVTGALVLASRVLADPGSPFLDEAAYLLVDPVVIAWAAVSRRFVVLIPVLLTVLGTGAWHFRGDLQTEVLVTTLGTAAFAGLAARLMCRGAVQADIDADLLSKQMAAQDAALGAEEAERRAANAVHDDVLSVLRTLSVADQVLPWSGLVAKAQQAQLALSQRVPSAGRRMGALGPALRRQVMESAASMDVRCDIEGDLDVPPRVVEALSAAAGEALRNVAVHAEVDSALVTACGDGSGGVTVTVSDQGAGFDPASVRAASRGLRDSIRGRLQDAGGNADVISSSGQGTMIILTWRPQLPVDVQAVDPLDWGRRLAPRPSLIFLAFMLPNLLATLALLVLRWQDLRWPITGVTVFLGLLILAIVCARCAGRVRMTRLTAAGLVIANTVLAALGALAVAPGTTDPYAYWVAGETTVVIAVVYFLRGPVFGLAALSLDLAALVAGLLVTGSGISHGGWVSVLASPVLAAGLGAGLLAAFRSLSSYTERQLAEYSERLRQHARAEAVSRVDSAALENARRVAGPVLAVVASGQPPSEELRSAATIANAMIRDELLAPGFLTADLADRVCAARMSGVRVTVDIARHENPALTDMARRLLAATMDQVDAVAEVTLQVHPPAEGHSALLVLYLRSRGTLEPVSLRECARDYGALVEDLGDNEFLLRLQAESRQTADAAAL